MNKELLVDYTIVHQHAGDMRKIAVKIVDAALDIFGHVKEKAMQLSVKGEFINFDTVDELIEKLESAVVNGFRIAVYDELIGG